jgi:outer membrane protein OmpA-like peptidoglycan-associated protein
MSQTSLERASKVGRLKELLFDSESRALEELAHRLEELAAQEPAQRAELERLLRAEIERLAGAQAADRLDMLSRLEAVFERAGTAERFRSSVADVLDGALRSAEVERHDELSEAMAPLVVRTIKTEIRNSQDELVDALYPMTGRMVKAYIASAMRDLMDQINHRLESNPVMLRVRSMLTGRSMAELALADTQQLEVEDLLLVRRATGELVARYPAEGSARDHVMGAILSAINSFAIEALGDKGTALREIDLGEVRLYLRASPLYLLAATCHGAAPPSIEQIIDDEFLAAIDAQHREVEAAGATGNPEQGTPMLLERLGGRLEQRISDKQAEVDGMPLGIRPGKALAWIAGVLLLGWLAWAQLGAYETNRVRSIALEMIDTTPEIKGYPSRPDVRARGRELVLTGLAPTSAAKDALLERLNRALPTVGIVDQIAIVPNSAAAIEPEIERVRRDLSGLELEFAQRTIRRAAARAQSRIESVLAELKRLTPTLDDRQVIARARELTASIEQASRELATMVSVAAAPARDAAGLEVLAKPAGDVGARLASASEQVALLLTPGAEPPRVRAEAGRQPLPVVEGIESMAAEAERLAAVTVALAQAHAAMKRVPPPAQPTVVVRDEPGPRAALEAFARSHAVFFSDDIFYRDEPKATATLDELARLMARTGDVVRLVGYTDERGAQSRNNSLSLARAQKVRDALVSRGVAESRLIAIGRPGVLDISPSIGTASPNRRVEFEIGFVGEAAN